MANIVVRDYGSERVISVSTDHLNDSRSADSLSRRLADMLEPEAPTPKVLDRNLSDRDQTASESSVDTLTLDFQQVGWVSSQGLNELISIKRLARTRGIRLIVANVQEPVREVFALTRLERMFELAEPHTQIN